MDKRTVIFVVVMTTVFFVVNHFLFPPRPTSVATQEAGVEKVAEALPKRDSFEKNEVLYVIENDYQQLVISSLNGAVAEINLPFENRSDPQSVVKTIWVDQELKESYPQTDYFPSRAYQTYEGSFSQGTLGSYYPLLRRNIAPAYYGLATMGESKKETRYQLKRLEKNLIELEGISGGVRLKKTYELPQNPKSSPYSFEFTVVIEETPSDLSLSTGIPEVEIISGSFSPSLKYRLQKTPRKAVVEQLSLPKKEPSLASIYPEWISNSNGFFAVLVAPQMEMNAGIVAAQVPGLLAPTRFNTIDAAQNRYPLENYPGYNLSIPFQNHAGTYKFNIFAGPLASSVLETNDLHFKADYKGMLNFHGWFAFISEPFAKFLFFLMKIFYTGIRSWGGAIILLTIALRAMMYPLNAWSIRSMIKMQKLSPKLAAVQERYKKDPKRAQMEIMSLYREHGVNPLGGCLPLLMQMPFLVGMFELLKSTFELRGVSFIPGWITNLTSPDVVFSWDTPIWFIGNSLHLLPILLGVVMFWQQRMSSTSAGGAKVMTDQQKQQKMMGNIMVVVFTVLFYHFPSGLNIYWLSSMLLAILQQWWMASRTVKL